MSVLFKMLLICGLSISTLQALTVRNIASWPLYVSVNPAGHCHQFLSPALYAVAGRTVYEINTDKIEKVCVTVSRRFYWDESTRMGVTGWEVKSRDNLKADQCHVLVAQRGRYEFGILPDAACHG